MNQKAYLLVCAAVFSLVAAGHLARLVTGWDITIAGWSVPHWISIPGLVVPGLLSARGFALAARREPMR
jgi:hypothetical protein